MSSDGTVGLKEHQTRRHHEKEAIKSTVGGRESRERHSGQRRGLLRQGQSETEGGHAEETNARGL